MSRSVPVNDEPHEPRLSRSDLWRGLVLKAENALPFVPQMSRCEVLERGEHSLLRDITVFGEDARERITLFPEQRVRFERVRGRTLGTIDNEILEDERGELHLRFAFALEAEGIPPGSPEEQQHFAATEAAYLNAVNATLAAIRRVVREQQAVPGSNGREPAVSEWIRDYFRTVDGMDLDAYLALHTDDVRFRFANAPTTTGKQAIREGLTQFWGSISGLRHDIVRTWDTGDSGVSEATCVYTRKDGSEVGIPTTTILRRRRGDLVEDIRIYIDLAPLFAPAAPEQQPAAAAAS